MNGHLGSLGSGPADRGWSGTPALLERAEALLPPGARPNYTEANMRERARTSPKMQSRTTRSTHTPTGRSAVRRGLTWWFGWPANPYVSVSGVVDFSASGAYLARLKGDGAPISVQHLLCSAVAQALRAYPIANARILANRVHSFEHVGVAMPVNLLGHAGGSRMELSLTVVERAETRTLLDLAERTREAVDRERGGQMQNGVLRALFHAAERAPTPLLFRGLDVVDRLAQQPPFARRLHASLPATTAITNPGSTLSPPDGLFFRGVAVNIPTRLIQIGTLWGISAIQREIIPVGDRPEVRPVLPFALVFDHRLFDGVIAGRLLSRFGELLLDPENAWGRAGDQLPPP